jgi:hypothetical protein
MCQQIPMDKLAVPCMFDAEGITTMPVSAFGLDCVLLFSG